MPNVFTDANAWIINSRFLQSSRSAHRDLGDREPITLSDPADIAYVRYGDRRRRFAVPRIENDRNTRDVRQVQRKARLALLARISSTTEDNVQRMTCPVVAGGWPATTSYMDKSYFIAGIFRSSDLSPGFQVSLRDDFEAIVWA